MSVILAWGDGERVVMAGDRQATADDHSRAWRTAKVNRLLVPAAESTHAATEMLIGTAGSLVATSLARHGLTPPKAPSPRKRVVDRTQWWADLDLERWAWLLGVELDRLMREQHATAAGDDQGDSVDYDAVIGWRGQVFEVGNGSVVPGHIVASGSLAGAGNGCGFGLGAATALLAEGVPPIDALRRAVEIACDYDPLSGGGVDIQELC